MTDAYAHRLAEFRSAAARAKRDGWLSTEQLKDVDELTEETPANLFDQREIRPLVVAFFGGTGVGKSSLINRLAGSAVARTGVVRPTSREVTLYLHESIRLESLPDEFPVASMRVAHHQEDDYRPVMWIDTPDFDSAESAHRDMVLQWLPYIDLVIYVVNPERYRDDQGWRLLLQHGAKHAWMFVVNHWDRGHEVQREDFVKLLHSAGFESPVVLRTDCSNMPGEDDFDTLRATVLSLCEHHAVRALEHRADRQRHEALSHIAGQLQHELGDDRSPEQALARWRQGWQDVADRLQGDLDWQMHNAANAMADHSEGLLDSVLRRFALGKEKKAEDKLAPEIPWDNWATQCVNAQIDQLVVEVGTELLPTQPLSDKVAKLKEDTERTMQDQMRRQLNFALTNPGTGLQRMVHKIMSVACNVLPMLAAIWVAYRVVAGFYISGLDNPNYLGGAFAVHALLLIGMAWFVPYVLKLRLQPSRQKAAYRGMQHGLTMGLADLGRQVEEILQHYDTHRESVRRTLQPFTHTPLEKAESVNQEEAKMLRRFLLKAPRLPQAEQAPVAATVVPQ